MISDIHERLPWPAASRRDRLAWIGAFVLVAAGAAGYATLCLASPSRRIPSGARAACAGAADTPAPQPKCSGDPASFEYWTVLVSEPGEEFSDRYEAGDLLFVPPATRFSVVSSPAGSARLRPAANWTDAGGRWTEGDIPGESIFVSPEKPGMYEFDSGTEDRACGLPPADSRPSAEGRPPIRPSLRVFVMVEAQAVRGPKGVPILSARGVRIGSYLDASRSGIVKVR